ncbi:MAG: alpha/beta fold hydrolase [Spirochaetota bacterium]
MKKMKTLLLLGFLLILFGGILAYFVQTDFGNVKIRDLRFNGPNGSVMSALLYIPKNATSKTPAPAILVVHGYINSRETQDGFAIEYARRGYVVLAIDQTGHGFSDPPAFANGFGGPAGLMYLRSLDIVDKNNIGMEGHSMGGWTILAAAAVFPDFYKSIVLEGSSTGAPFAKEGDISWPKNVAVVFSKMDEFSLFMWGVKKGIDIPNSPKLQALFGTTEKIVEGKIYGDIDVGNARVLYQPNTTHPQDHISKKAIGYSIDWFAKTLQGGKNISSSNQIWFFKELGTLIALIGCIIFILGFSLFLLSLPGFQNKQQEIEESKVKFNAVYIISALVSMLIAVLSYYWTFKIGAKIFKASWLFPQTITSQIMTWALFNGLVNLIIFLLVHYIFNKKAGFNCYTYGFTDTQGKIHFSTIINDFLFAFFSIFSGYLMLVLADYFFKIDFRFWIIALKPMSIVHFGIFLRYLIPFFIFFFISSFILNGSMRLPTKSHWLPYIVNMIIMAGAFIIFILVEYIPLFTNGMLLTSTEPLNTIIAIQFIPLLIIASIFSTWFFRRTGRVYAGAFANALFITWYIVASQATHFPL